METSNSFCSSNTTQYGTTSRGGHRCLGDHSTRSSLDQWRHPRYLLDWRCSASSSKLRPHVHRGGSFRQLRHVQEQRRVQQAQGKIMGSPNLGGMCKSAGLVVERSGETYEAGNDQSWWWLTVEVRFVLDIPDRNFGTDGRIPEGFVYWLILTSWTVTISPSKTWRGSSLRRPIFQRKKPSKQARPSRLASTTSERRMPSSTFRLP